MQQPRIAMIRRRQMTPSLVGAVLPKSAAGQRFTDNLIGWAQMTGLNPPSGTTWGDAVIAAYMDDEHRFTEFLQSVLIPSLEATKVIRENDYLGMLPPAEYERAITRYKKFASLAYDHWKPVAEAQITDFFEKKQK